MGKKRAYIKEHLLKIKGLELILGVYHQKKKDDKREVPYCDVILEGKVRETFRCNEPVDDGKRYSAREIKSIAKGFALLNLIPKRYSHGTMAINARKTAPRL